MDRREQELISVLEVVRDGEGVAREVVVGTGGVIVSYILRNNGEIFEKGRWTEKQTLDIDGLTIPLMDYRQALKVAAAILREKSKKAVQK